MRRIRPHLAFILLALVAACGEDDGEIEAIAFATVYERDLSGYPTCCEEAPVQAPRMFRFDDAEGFDDFWSYLWVTPIVPDIPDIDFETESIFAVVDRVKGHRGDTIRVTSVNRFDDQLVVDVLLRELGSHCLRNALYGQPIHVISIPKTRGRATMMLTTEQIPCSRPDGAGVDR